MRKTIVCVCCLLMAFATGQASSQARKRPAPVTTSAPQAAANWDKEPTSFMSIRLGAALPSEWIECPRPSSPYEFLPATKDPTRPCVKDHGSTIQLYQMPEIGVFIREINVIPYKGSIGTVVLIGNKPEFGSIKTLMVKKYGPPTRTSIEQAGNRAGAVFEYELLQWDGKDVSIRAQELYDRIDTFGIFVFHNPTIIQQAEEKEIALKAKKDNL